MIPLLINILIVSILLIYRHPQKVVEPFDEISNMFKLLFKTNQTSSFSDIGNFRPTTPGVVGSKDWLQQPKIQEQLRGMEQLYKHEVIRAIHEGRTPPHSVGVGTYTRQSLLRDWDDEWEAIASKMGIKLFQKRRVHGTPGPYAWVDARPEKTLSFRTGSNPPPLFAKPNPPPNPPPPTSRVFK